MKKTLRIIGGIAVGTALLAVLSFRVYVTHAAGGRYFGGMKLYTFTCTCTGNTLLYIQDYASHGTLALIYQEGSSKLFAHNNAYGTYLLGSYSQGGQCEYYVAEDCVEMNSDGEMDSNPGTGTS